MGHDTPKELMLFFLLAFDVHFFVCFLWKKRETKGVQIKSM